MTIDDVLGRLRAGIEGAGGASSWAASKDISGSYVSDVLNKRRDPGDRILAALGMEKVVSYRDISE